MPYTYPIGIPTAWIDPTTEAPARPVDWSSPVAGYYYVNWTTGTDSGRTYGTPTAPRKTIPTLGPGSLCVVEGVYSAVGSPVFLRGLGDSGTWVAATSGPVWLVAEDPLFPCDMLSWTTFLGSYFIIDGFTNKGAAPPWQIGTSATTQGYNAHHILLRNCEIDGKNTLFNTALPIVGSTTYPVFDVVVYGNHVHHIGRAEPPLPDDPYDPDHIAIFPIDNSSNIWIVDNHIHDVTGAGVGVGAYTTGASASIPREIYIGRNHVYNTWAAGIAAKSSDNVIVSQNHVHDIIWTAGSQAKCISAQYNIKHMWVMFNHCYNGDMGFKMGSGAGPDPINIYLIGNVIHDIYDPPVELDPTPPAKNGYYGAITMWAGDAKVVVGNTVYNAHNGIVFPGSGTDLGSAGFVVENNIVANIDNYHLEIDTGAEHSMWRNNLLYQDGGSVSVKLGSVMNVATANALSYVDGLLEADPVFVDEGADETDRDLAIQTTSPAKNAGLADTALTLDVYNLFLTNHGTPIDYDFNGGERPADTAWDIGAYEFGAAIPPPPPPAPTFTALKHITPY